MESKLEKIYVYNDVHLKFRIKYHGIRVYESVEENYTGAEYVLLLDDNDSVLFLVEGRSLNIKTSL